MDPSAPDDPGFQAPDPTDTPLRDVSESVAGGAEGQFRATEGSRIQCLTCREEAPAEAYHAEHAARLEGASDPADMVMVVPVTCPNCGAQGSMVLGYGPNASAEDADALSAMERH
jgi:hypothetical protein